MVHFLIKRSKNNISLAPTVRKTGGRNQPIEFSCGKKCLSYVVNTILLKIYVCVENVNSMFFSGILFHFVHKVLV